MANFRQEQGLESRVPEQYRDYIVTLDNIDSIVYEFGRGCEEGQQDFVDFVMSKVLTTYEWAAVQSDRNFIRFCWQWNRYKELADDPHRRPCVHGFESMYDEETEYEWPFCVNCYKTADQHCSCGDCETGAEHLRWALDHGIVVRGT